jgi:hypothetical protein
MVGQVSGLGARALVEGGDGLVSGLTTRVLTQYPSEEGRSTGLSVRTLNGGEGVGQVASMVTRLLIKGRVDDPKVRAWTYTMDGHDFYILRLGITETLVYDTHSEQWYTWATRDTDLWRPFDGINWLGAQRWSREYGSNVIVGDDANGSLYFLDPTTYVDDTPFTPVPEVDGEGVALDPMQEQFQRIVQGQVVKRGHDMERCYSVELNGSMGKMDNSSLTAVTLYTSDDQGISYVDQGTVTISNEDYEARMDWRSLGAFSRPGRLFKVVDFGALSRIDSLTMESDRE